MRTQLKQDIMTIKITPKDGCAAHRIFTILIFGFPYSTNFILRGGKRNRVWLTCF